MRVSVRTLFATLWVGLLCGVIYASAPARPDAPETGSAFHQPFHPPPAMEAAPLTAAVASADESTGTWITGIAPKLGFCARVATPRNRRVVSPAAENALYQRPPPTRLS